MAFAEMHPALEEARAKKGETRNPSGNNGRKTMKTNIEIRRALYSGLARPYPDGSGRTYWDVAMDSLITKFANGERWAMHFVCDRLFGRVPYNVNLDVTQRIDLSRLTEDQLAARLERIRSRLLADGLIDATPVTPSPPDARVNPGEDLTLDPETDVPGQGKEEVEPS